MTTPERSRAAALMGAACKGKPKTISADERLLRRMAMIAMNKARAAKQETKGEK